MVFGDNFLGLIVEISFYVNFKKREFSYPFFQSIIYNVVDTKIIYFLTTFLKSWVHISDNIAGGGIGIGNTVQKMQFSIKDFSSKCDRSHRNLRNWSHLLKKSLLKNFIFLEWKKKGILNIF